MDGRENKEVELPTVVDEREMARILKISPRTLFTWRKAGRVPYVGEGRIVRYETDRVIAALRNTPAGA